MSPELVKVIVFRGVQFPYTVSLEREVGSEPCRRATPPLPSYGPHAYPHNINTLSVP